MTARILVRSLLLSSLITGVAIANEGGPHGQYGNPSDLDRYITALMDPDRDAWQQPGRVIEALQIEAGDTVCDVGSGPGYFTLRLARAVGPTGRIYAVDVEPVILAELRHNLQQVQVRNVTPVLGAGDDSLLPPSTCDLVLIVNTYHHFPDGLAYLAGLMEKLSPRGRIVNIDFRVAADFGPPHRIAREEFLAQARDAGFNMEREMKFLEQQYFIVLKPAS